ncbi:uncharacterized protein LOC113237975 [Hyposmocoma kahamanoa]|uniref:uncharacterized protein LOC113237975 n=1 Tax=Hyposmocoma kahamanoa TaxID=1477025 RepID=UPI000E6D9468|nr:uncharacterized protein LOC113237975 [Hyposmocoma kahamanoa]
MARHLRLKHPKVYQQMQGSLEKRKKPAYERTKSLRCWVKKYCSKIGNTKYQCDICDKVLSLPHGLFGNMKRHIRSKHPYVYDQEVNDLIGIRIETVDTLASDTKEYLEDVEEFTTNKSEEGGDEDSAQEEADSESEQVDSGTVLNETDPNFEKKIKYFCTKPVSGKKRASNPMWNFFETIEKNHLYMCLGCNKQLSIYPHSIANLKRHIKMKHKKQYEYMMKYLTPRKSCIETRQKSYRCWVKKYCSKIGGRKYQCDICDQILSLPLGLFGNMKRHIRSKHPHVYDQEVNDLTGIMIETVNTPASDTKEYLEDVEEFTTNKSEEGDDEDSAQKEADSELEQVDSGTVLNEADPNFEEKIKYFCTKPVSGKKRASNPMWNFFETIEANHLYMCLGCNKQLSIYPHSIANLKRHIKMKHKKQYEYMMKYLTPRKSCIESGVD